MRRALVAAALFPVFAGVAGCPASWVWNERFLECDAYSDVLVSTWGKPMTLQVGPYQDPDPEDEPCEVQTEGLVGASFFRDEGGGDFEAYNVGRAYFRHTGDELVVDTFRVEWGACPDIGGVDWACGEGFGGLLELDAVTLDGPDVGYGLAGVRLFSETSGNVVFATDGAVVTCADCSVRGALRNEEPIEVRVTDTADDGVVDLCFSLANAVDLQLEGHIEGPVRLEFVTRPSVVDLKLPDGDPIDVELWLPPSDVPYRFEGVPGYANPGGDGPQILVEGAASVTVRVSDGQCDPVEFDWDAL